MTDFIEGLAGSGVGGFVTMSFLVIIGLGVGVGLVAILRVFVTWFYSINQIIELLQNIKTELQAIRKATDRAPASRPPAGEQVEITEEMIDGAFGKGGQGKGGQ